MAALTSVDSVSIDGLVRQPGRYPLARGMSVKDLVLAAGGFEQGAYTLTVEVARARSTLARGDTVSTVYRVPLTRDFAPVAGDTLLTVPNADGRIWTPAADEFELSREDRVLVRRMPGHEEPWPVRITGEVEFPGLYVLHSRQERLTQLVERSGGITGEAHPPGIQVWRKGRLLAIDVSRALSNPRSGSNVALEAGDSIHVPRYDPTVFVTGAVGFETRVLFDRGRDLDYYIGQAGGYAEDADARRTSVVHQNGERETRRGPGLLRRDVRVSPGSTIYVPSRAPGREGFNWDQALTRVLTVMSTVATLLIAYQQLK